MIARARSAEKCGDPAVAVHRQGRQDPCRGAEADPHRLFRRLWRLPQLQYIDKVVDVSVSA